MRHEITVLKGRPYPVGMTVTGKNEMNLAAVLTCRRECGVILYPKKKGAQIRIPFREEDRIGDVYCMKLSGICADDYEYNFYTDKEIITDPYATRIVGNEKWGKRISPALRAGGISQDFDWGEDRPLLTALCDSVLYQLHVRGFTRHASSGVAHPGTFWGITEKIPYLKELGITAVELMPAYEFLELEQEKSRGVTMEEAVRHYMDRPAEEKTAPHMNYWGFKKGYYFSPKASYSSTEDAATEFKRMVKALHENGLELIMQFFFPKEIAPGFILDVLRYWVMEYHIDGAHLMGERVPALLLATDPMLASVKLFYYDFPCDEIYGGRERISYKNLACYRDDFLYDMRRFLKGDEDSLSKALSQLKKNPERMGAVNYIANYEGFSLADLVSYEQKHNEANGEDNRDGNSYNASWNCGEEGASRRKSILRLRRKQMRNALLLLFTAQATPMLVAGDEFGHSRGGNNNPYCQDNAVNWLNWKQTEKNKDFLEFVRTMIALRKKHPVLHREDALTQMDYIACGYPDLSYHGKDAWRMNAEPNSREAGVMYCGNYVKVDRDREDDFFYIAYNMHWIKKEFALPALPAGLHWEKVVDSETGCMGPDGEALAKSVTAPPRSILILQSFGTMVEKGNGNEGVTAF